MWLKGSAEGTCVAYKQKVAIKVDNSGSGAGGDSMALTGSLLYKGDPVKGAFDTKNLKFTEASDSSNPMPTSSK